MIAAVCNLDHFLGCLVGFGLALPNRTAHAASINVHLVLFGYIYPGERNRIPAQVMHALLGMLTAELDTAASNGSAKLCRGTLLSRQQYLIDINEWGYKDIRKGEDVNMTDTQIRLWTAGIEKDGSPHND